MYSPNASNLSEEGKRSLAEPIERYVEAEELLDIPNYSRLSTEELRATFNYRLSEIERILYEHDKSVNAVSREFHDCCQSIVPTLKLLKAQAIKCESRYTSVESEVLSSTSTNDLARSMREWARHMNVASYRLHLETQAVEFAFQKLCTVASEKNRMFEFIRHAVLDMRYLYDRVCAGRIVESTGTQTDDLDSSIDYQNFKSNVESASRSSSLNIHGFEPIMLSSEDEDMIIEGNESYESLSRFSINQSTLEEKRKRVYEVEVDPPNERACKMIKPDSIDTSGLDDILMINDSDVEDLDSDNSLSSNESVESDVEANESRTEGVNKDTFSGSPSIQSTSSPSLRGSMRGRYYGNIGNRTAHYSRSHTAAPTQVRSVTSPLSSPILVPPQNVGLAKSLHIPLWEDDDTTLIRWENEGRDLIPTQILGRRHHIFLKKSDRSGIRVIMKKEGITIDFEAPPFLNSPIPRLSYGDLQHLFAPQICVQFVLAGQFLDTGRMVAVHVDFNSRYNFVSQGLLPPREECEYQKIESRTVPFSFEEYNEIQVDYEVPLIVRGRNAKIVPIFHFTAFLVTKDKVPHFPFQRLVLGKDFMERYAVSMHGTTDRGEIYMEDEERRIYAQSFEKKRGESWAYPVRRS